MHNVANISPARNRHGRVDSFAAAIARDAFATQARQARQWDERRGFRDVTPAELCAVANWPIFAPARRAHPVMRIDNPAFRREIEAIHRLGPRALGELLIEISADPATLARWARLNSSIVQAVGGDLWPSFEPYEVAV